MTAAPPVRPAVLVAAHSVPKQGRTRAENEDSVAVDADSLRFAVADGASTSARSKLWSSLLVRCYVEQRTDPLAADALGELRARWLAEATADPSLPWYAQAKIMEGAGSTFLGLRIDPETAGYEATGVGDSCLFHFRRDTLVAVGPIARSDRFDRFPDLVSSRPGAAAPAPMVITGTCRPGDVLVLATDAVARFLLASFERHGRAPSIAGMVGDQARFLRGVIRLRTRRLLANDDSPVCQVQV